MTTARGHLDWCVERAMEYANRGDMTSAWASFGSDVLKHEGTCPGPLVWFDAGPEEAAGAIVECATCGYIATTGNFHDPAHAQTPVMGEGLAS